MTLSGSFKDDSRRDENLCIDSSKKHDGCRKGDSNGKNSETVLGKVLSETIECEKRLTYGCDSIGFENLLRSEDHEEG